MRTSQSVKGATNRGPDNRLSNRLFLTVKCN